MKNKVEFVKRLVGLGELYDKNLSESLISIYWDALKAYGDEDIQAAISKTAVTCKFFPRPSEIIEVMEGSPEGRAAEAFHLLQDAVSRIGPYQSVLFTDPGTQFVVEAWGGWPEVCSWPEDEWKYKVKDFAALYGRAGQRPMEKKHFAGLTEGTNRVDGHEEHIPDPVQIGNHNGRLLIGAPEQKEGKQ